MKSLLNMFIVVSVSMWTGCIPFRSTTRTGVSGSVTDAQTGLAIPHATVTLLANNTCDGPVELSAQSDSVGTFRIPAHRRLGILIIGPLDPLRWSTRITITAPGYVSFDQTYPCSTVGPGVIKLPHIKLEHER